MKTTVTINEETLKAYYIDLFIKYHLWITLVIFITGTLASIFYMIDSKILDGIFVLTISIFLILVVVFMNINSCRIALKDLDKSIKEYSIEFKDNNLIVSTNLNTKVFNYNIVKLVNLKHFYRYQIKDQSNVLIYIIPKKNFDLESWNKLNLIFTKRR